MDNRIDVLREEIKQKLSSVGDLAELDKLRVGYLGKKGSITALLKGMKDLTNEERKTFGAEVNKLKANAAELIDKKVEELNRKAIEAEINLMPVFDVTTPPELTRGSYHPVTLSQRQCEAVFKSMGFTVEDYAEVVTDYECFEAVNIPKHHPARDMQDTYYLENGQLLKTQTSAAQTDACHENTFFQMEGMMVDKDISISNLIYFMKTMLSEVFQRDIKVRLRPGFFPFVEPGFELDINCEICGGEGCPSCKHSGWLELCPCGMIHPNVLREGGVDPEKYTGFAFGLGLTRLAMMKYGVKDIRDLNSGSLKALSQFTDDDN